MKSLWKGALFSILGAALLLALNHFILWRMLNQSEAGYIQPIHQYRELVYPKLKANVVIIGTSHTAHGINPAFLESEGVRVFNFSLSGAGASYYYDWYVHLFRRYYPKPEIFIIGVDWFIFNNKYLTRRLADDIVYLPWKAVMLGLLDPSFKLAADELLKSKLSIMSGKQHLLDSVFSSIPGNNPAQKYYRGYIPFNMKYDGCGGVIHEHDTGIHLSPEEENLFDLLLDQLTADGIKMIFVQTPELIPCRMSDDDSMLLLMEIARRRGIPFFDYNAELASRLNFRTDYFSTWGHLNEKGSSAFSARLARDLARFLPAKPVK